MIRFAAQWRNAQGLIASWSVCLIGMVLFTSCESSRDSQANINPPPAPVVTEVSTPPVVSSQSQEFTAAELLKSAAVSTHPAVSSQSQNPEARNELLKVENVRSECINGRRRLCGLVLQVDDNGLVVDSGYTDLLRPELSHSWVVPSTAIAGRPANLVEENFPGSVGVGLVYITALPKRPSVKQYDYVVLQAYPAGDYTYAPVQNVKRKIRKFAVELDTAVRLNLSAAQK